MFRNSPFALFLLSILISFFIHACDKPASSPLEAFQTGDFEVAYRGFHQLAEKGDLEAQNYLGVMHYLGLGRKRDLSSARDWFEKAASEGFPGAQFNLGNMYQNGEAVKQDFMTSYMWFYAAHEQGHKQAEERMTILLHDHKLFANQVERAIDMARPYILHGKE